jgi:hypothetical protein
MTGLHDNAPSLDPLKQEKTVRDERKTAVWGNQRPETAGMTGKSATVATKNCSNKTCEAGTLCLL